MEQIVKDAAGLIALTLLVIGLIGYLFALGFATFGSLKPNSFSSRLKTWFMESPAQNIGIPCSAIAAFVIVLVLFDLYPVNVDKEKDLSIVAFGLKFSGPSGPITLWLLCFLAFVIALKALRK